MSTENKEQERSTRRGPDPRFVLGIVAVVVLGGILYGGYVKYEELSNKLDNSVSKEQYNNLVKSKDELKKELEDVKTVFKSQVENLDTKISQHIGDNQSDIKSLNDKIQEHMNNLETLESHNLSIPGKQAGERKTIVVNGVEFAFRWCPPGSFKMGASEAEVRENRFSDGFDLDRQIQLERLHDVTLFQDFWILETEVTVGMFKLFVNETGYKSKITKLSSPDNQPAKSWLEPGYKQDDTFPVIGISWNDASEFCKWLSAKIRLKVQLPNDEQWEYACRAGTTGLFAGDIDKMAWYYKDNNRGYAYPVGTKEPNAWGVYDMHGNVWELCSNKEVIRGGSFCHPPRNCRSAIRHPSVLPEDGSWDKGFRCVIVP